MVGLWQPCSGANARFGKSRRRDGANALCDWLEATAGRTRVVSTTRQPLFPLLEAGTFVETLYYRAKCSPFPGDRMRQLTVLGATR